MKSSSKCGLEKINSSYNWKALVETYLSRFKYPYRINEWCIRKKDKIINIPCFFWKEFGNYSFFIDIMYNIHQWIMYYDQSTGYCPEIISLIIKYFLNIYDLINLKPICIIYGTIKIEENIWRNFRYICEISITQ